MKKVYSMMWMAMMAALTMTLSACSDDDDEQMNTEEIVKNLATLGGQALLLAVAGTLGSLLAAALVYRYLFQEKRRDNE